MKRYTFILITALILEACTGGKQHTGPETEHSTVHQKTEQPANHAEEKSDELVLNNGQKWQLDDPTRANMSALNEAVNKTAAQPTRDYQQLTTTLQETTDKLVKECKMKGPDHDALHVWLKDYLPTLKQLHSTDTSEQEKAFQAVQADLIKFYQYFE